MRNEEECSSSSSDSQPKERKSEKTFFTHTLTSNKWRQESVWGMVSFQLWPPFSSENWQCENTEQRNRSSHTWKRACLYTDSQKMVIGLNREKEHWKYMEMSFEPEERQTCIWFWDLSVNRWDLSMLQYHSQKILNILQLSILFRQTYYFCLVCTSWRNTECIWTTFQKDLRQLFWKISLYDAKNCPHLFWVR